MKKQKIIISSILALAMISGCTGNVDSSSTSSSVSEVSQSSESSTEQSISSSESSSSQKDSIDEELELARERANNYIDSIDLDLYREAERNNIAEAIRKAKEAIESPDATVDSIESVINSLKTYVSSQKTDAQYLEEEKIAQEAALKKAKEEKLAEIKVDDLYQYREEEISTINSDYSALSAQINDAETLEALEKIDTAAFINKVKSLKTNASYTMDEIYKYPLINEWPLLNENYASWTYDSNVIHANSTSYMIDSGNVYGDVKVSFTVSANHDVGIAGVMKVRQNETGTGLDGYLINIVSNPNAQYVQVFYLSNCYCAVGDPVPVICEYIGGWVYPGRVLGTTFRITFEGSTCIIMDEADYMKNGNSAASILVDLTNNNKYQLIETGSLGILNWEDNSNDISINKIITNENSVVSSKATASKFVNDYVSSIDISLYRNAEQQIINSLFDDINTYMNGNDYTYSEAVKKLDSMKEQIKNLKTDAQYTKEENESNLNYVKEQKKSELRDYVANSYPESSASAVEAILNEAAQVIDACETVDAVHAIDLNPYQERLDALPSYATELCNSIINDPTTSDWPLVTEHSATWIYSEDKPNQIITNSIAWQLNNKDYDNCDAVFSVSGTSDLGKVGLGVLFRANKVPGCDTFNSYLINIVSNSQNQFVQVFYIKDAFGQVGMPDQVIQYIGGWVYPGSTNGATFRVRFEGSLVTIFDENDYQSGNKNPGAIVDLTCNGAYPLYESGKIGILNWDGTNTTFVFDKIQKIVK